MSRLNPLYFSAPRHGHRLGTMFLAPHHRHARGNDRLGTGNSKHRPKEQIETESEKHQQESLDGFWESLTAEQLAGVEAVAMDMWEPYVQSTLSHVPGAASKIVHDPFHLVQYMNDAVQ